ncbi:MAG: GNAT family N-acetyltransferase [Anaerolineae bacterium]|nr:GNAT family N-acetyltransferase [Anaerolineae bacterium]
MKITTHDDGRDHKRELWIDGVEEAVSRLLVIEYAMRIGTAVVRMAGIGDVHTHWQHRRKGYMRHLYEDSVRYMIAEGYDISMLFGIENFYTKFGYAAGLAAFECKVKTRDAEVAAASNTAAKAAAKSYVTRSIGEADMPAVLELYNANNATRVCSVVRTLEDFSKFEKGTWYGTPPDTQLWEDANGKLLAYAAWDHYDKAMKVAEVEARNDAIFPTILSFFAAQAVDKRCEDVQLFIPPDHPFAEYVQRFGAEWKLVYPRYGSGMLRLLNPLPFFEKIVPELERRLALSHSTDYAGALTLQTDLETVALVINRGNVAVTSQAQEGLRLELSQDKLTQLAIGYRSARDVLNDPQVTAHGDVLPLLDILFPKRTPYIWVADHF